MRDITELLPDVKIAAPGVPDFLALYYLTRAVSEFLDRTEAWKEFGPTRTVDQLRDRDGYLSWVNHLDETDNRYLRIKRCVHLKWSTDGDEIPFQTIAQLQRFDNDWAVTEGSRAQAFTLQSEQDPDNTPDITQFAVRVYPLIADDVDGTIYLTPYMVIATDSVSLIGITLFDEAEFGTPLPDRIFYAWRNQLVSGALSQLYMLPGKDWTDLRLGGLHLEMFEQGIIRAESRAGNEFGRTTLSTGYGGI